MFTDWPNAPSAPRTRCSITSGWSAPTCPGLRLLVQHATTNKVLCELVIGIGANPKRYDCNDMVAVDRIIEETYALERYIDALSGGPGKGWFRIVFSPAEAREEIKAGKLAVVLGIETSNLFDCFLVPFGEFSKCTEADVVAKLDEYHAKGVRVLFPVHKYDNGFSAGDGDRGVIDIGNFVHTGHYSNFVNCPDGTADLPGGFDNGGMNFAGLNQPRDSVRFTAARRHERLRRQPHRYAGAVHRPARRWTTGGRVLPEPRTHRPRRIPDAGNDEARHDHRGRPHAQKELQARLRDTGGK